MQKFKRALKGIAFLLVLVSTFYIVVADVGASQEQKSGAGDIWWAGIQSIQESYEKVVNN